MIDIIIEMVQSLDKQYSCVPSKRNRRMFPVKENLRTLEKSNLTIFADLLDGLRHTCIETIARRGMSDRTSFATDVGDN